MDNDDSHPLYAHVSTRERLRAAQELLKQQGIPMPQTSVGLGMRGDHLHRGSNGPGWFTHAVGFAVDWRAYHAPRITDPRMITLFQTVTGGDQHSPHFDLGLGPDQRLDLITRMGQGTATPAESKAFLDRLEVEYKRLAADSEKFRTDLPAANLATLRDLGIKVENARAPLTAATKRLDELKRARAAPDKLDAAQKAVDAAGKAFDDVHGPAVAQLAELFEPWVQKLDAEIDKIDKLAADADVDLTKLTGPYGLGELTTRIAELGRLRKSLTATATTELRAVLQIEQSSLAIGARVDAAQAFLADPGRTGLPPEAATWGTDLDGVETRNKAVADSLVPLKTALGGMLPEAVLDAKPLPAPRPAPVRKQTVTALQTDVDRLPPRVAKSAAVVHPAAARLAETTTELSATTDDLAERKTYNAEKVTALGGGTGKAEQRKGQEAVKVLLAQKTKWLSLKAAKDGLINDAEEFVFRGKRPGDAGVVQLVGQVPGTGRGGVFSPDPETGGEKDAKSGDWSTTQGFNLAFMKAMVSSGFELGVAWKGGSDPMHFELAEGRRLLTSHGAEPLVAGATLKAEEVAAEKAAADKAAADKAAADKAAKP
jgi:hypothetical protein